MTEPIKPNPEISRALTKLLTNLSAAVAKSAQKVADDLQVQRSRIAIASTAVAAGAVTELDYFLENQ